MLKEPEKTAGAAGPAPEASDASPQDYEAPRPKSEEATWED